MNTRIIYKKDKTVVQLRPDEKTRRKGETDKQMIDRLYKKMVEAQPELKGLPYEDKHPDELPKTDGAKWRGSKGKGVHEDETVKTEAEKRQALEYDIDSELALDAPDLLKIARLQRRLQKGEY